MTKSEQQGAVSGGSPSAGAISWPAPGARPINCDQVAWMLAAISRYLPPYAQPSVSRQREMQKYGLLYEIMESANLHFEDDIAQHNGTPPDAIRFRHASKEGQVSSNALRA
jgi:hypothetical protein